MYKAFISSTFEDLSQHRAEAIRALQAAGFLVDQMENWQADRDTPVHFSAARLDACKLCILLVGFRRGSVPEGAARSITQIEYDEARRRKIDVLPFLLAEQTAIGDGGWNPEFDERKRDPGIDAWRRLLRQTHGVGEFGADPKSLRIEPALARWVVQAESDRATRFRRFVLAAMASVVFILAIGLFYTWHVYNTPDLRAEYHSRYLAFHDPNVFYGAKNGTYSVARVLSDGGALRQNTNLNGEFAATQVSLDLLANNAQNIHDQLAETLRRVIRNGASVRFILWDYTPRNRASYDAFQYAINQPPEEPRGAVIRVRRELEQLEKEVATDRGTYKGRFNLRWNERPLLYTMWIRDWDQKNRKNALGHLGIHFYRGQTFWPSFRVSAQDGDGSELLDNMHEEFEYAWKTSVTTIPDDTVKTK
jgi:Domain of unknown function (DUF4062)